MSNYHFILRKTLTFLIFAFGTTCIFGQSIVETIPKIYHSDTNIIQYSYSNYPERLSLDLNESDTVSPGTDTYKGIIMTAYIGKDTLFIRGDNYPLERHSYVTVQTPTGNKVILFRYNSSPNYFSQAYILANQQKISFESPEVYELANIIWTLSPGGQEASDLQKDTRYFKKVEKYFKPYLKHPLFEKLATNDTNYFEKYYEFRENSFMYEFKGQKIVKGENYNFVFGRDWREYTNLFTDLLPLIQDFSDKSNFREFYRKNRDFYSNNKKKVQDLLPIQNMWNWLEKEFPERVDTYKIVFSPLILGSHSTQKYIGSMLTNDSTYRVFTETIMFICDAQHLNNFKGITKEEKQGLMSGIVFTEIDHNYVNPISSGYWEEIEPIFTSAIWTDVHKNAMYDNPVSVFNEYMTHSLFCLWVAETYPVKTAEFVIGKRIELNTKHRGFVKFEEFNTALMRIRKENPDKQVSELYPKLLDWCRAQNN